MTHLLEDRTRLLLSVLLARHPWLRDTDHAGVVVHRAVVWGA